MKTGTHNLLGLTASELGGIMEGLGEPRYRAGQLFRWMYAKGATDFAGMTDLSARFRARLPEVAHIGGITLAAEQRSEKDGTTKFLFSLADGLQIESVLIPPASAFTGTEAAGEDEQKRLTLCVSTQVGCPLDCKFCATATMGLARNLTPGEIVDQVLQVRRRTGRIITNIVFMGMGEPLLNYDNVMKAVEIISTGIGIAARRITISTAGRTDRIRQLGDEHRRTKLAVSLHSAVDDTRTRLMPINKKYNLDILRSAIDYYYTRTKQRVTYEFIFFDGVNDTQQEVAALIRFARKVPSKINVIPYHSIAFTNAGGLSSALRPSPRTNVIVDQLRAANLTVMVRSSSGEDIDAACGQLAVSSRTRRQQALAVNPAHRLSPRPHRTTSMVHDE